MEHLFSSLLCSGFHTFKIIQVFMAEQGPGGNLGLCFYRRTASLWFFNSEDHRIHGEIMIYRTLSSRLLQKTRAERRKNYRETYCGGLKHTAIKISSTNFYSFRLTSDSHLSNSKLFFNPNFTKSHTDHRRKNETNQVLCFSQLLINKTLFIN
jgi:hypothetical protein